MTSLDETNLGKPKFEETGATEAHSQLTQEQLANKAGLWGSSSTLGWLGLWFAIALLIRFTNLASKPAWMDEVSTVMFSLGNSSRFIPVNQVIDLNQILVGLSLRPEATALDAANYLLQENNHPPAYFVIAHWWMQLFHMLKGSPDGYASLWAARALPAVFGALAVPATYILGWLSFRDIRDLGTQSSAKARSIGLAGAALMAVSPYSVFLSQEARHYTLAILMIIASLSCFVVAVKAVWPAANPPLAISFSEPPLSQSLAGQSLAGRSLSWITVIAWVVINTLSIAVHYFCGIAICAEGGVLLTMLVRQCQTTTAHWQQAPWIKVYVAAVGSLAGALIWLPILLNFYGSPQTTYIKAGTRNWKFWIDPVVQSIAGWLYALLAPITNGFGWQRITTIVVTTLLLLAIYAPWMLRALRRGLQHQWAQPVLKPGVLAIGGFFVVSNALFFLICYGVGFDITRGHRYAFVYFPGVIMLAGIGLAPYWQREQTASPQANSRGFGQVKLPFTERLVSGRAFVTTVIGIGFLGTQVITHDLTHLKFYEPDRFVNQIRETSTYPVVVGIEAIVGDQPSVIGNEIVSVAWEIQRQLRAGIKTDQWQGKPKFTIVVQNAATQNKATEQLAENLETLLRPFDLWLLHISSELSELDDVQHVSSELNDVQCIRPIDSQGSTGSFRFTHYICAAS